MRDVAIIGIGATEQGEIAGQTTDHIAARAARAAIADAGLVKSDIDGLVTSKPPRGEDRAGIDDLMGQLLGLNPRFSSTLDYGGCGFSLHLAAMAISSGLASTVLLTFGTTVRSHRTNFASPQSERNDWYAPHGFFHVAGRAAMAVQRHMALYGTTERQLACVSSAQREWASANPRAIFRTPLSVDEYLAMPYWVAPLRRPDLTMRSDGGVAIVVASGERAAHAAQRPVYLRGISQASGLRYDHNPDNLMRPWIGEMASRLYANTGITPANIDAAYLQDATSFWVLQQLEQYGFCGIGEGGPFLAEGHTRPGGRLPVNTGGGQLSESYSWNWLNLYEAVDQLRGTAGSRQLERCEIALHAQTHDFWKGAATLLSPHRLT